MFDWFRKRWRQSRSRAIRDTLFGDMALADWAHGEDAIEPCSQFSEVRRRLDAQDSTAAKALLQEIVATPDLESRHYLQAWNELRRLGIEPGPKARQLLGVVVEISLADGLDILAAYADGSARYFSFVGGAVIWDRPDASLDPQLGQLFQSAGEILTQIAGPWEGARPPAPPRGEVRINMLTPAGLFFGQGPLRRTVKPLAVPAIEAATELMQALVGKVNAAKGA